MRLEHPMERTMMAGKPPSTQPVPKKSEREARERKPALVQPAEPVELEPELEELCDMATD